MTVIFNFTLHHFYALSKERTLLNLTLVIHVYKSSNSCQKVLLIKDCCRTQIAKL